MEESQFPKRSEKHKSKWKEGPPTNALLLGSMWIFFELIPQQWKSVWVSALILILSLYISFEFDKLKLSPTLKWGISLSVYGVGLIFSLLSHGGENQVDDKIMEMPFPELYSNLAIAPLYIIQLILCIGYLIFLRKEKGCFLLIGKIYSLFIVVNYIVALYFRFFH